MHYPLHFWEVEPQHFTTWILPCRKIDNFMYRLYAKSQGPMTSFTKIKDMLIDFRHRHFFPFYFVLQQNQPKPLAYMTTSMYHIFKWKELWTEFHCSLLYIILAANMMMDMQIFQRLPVFWYHVTDHMPRANKFSCSDRYFTNPEDVSDDWGCETVRIVIFQMDDIIWHHPIYQPYMNGRSYKCITMNYKLNLWCKVL